MKISWPGEDRPPSPVAPMADGTPRSPKFATVRISGPLDGCPRFAPRFSAITWE